MNRPLRVILIAAASLAVILATAACGTERISVPRSDPTLKSDESAAQLFAQRCAGCHTLSYAATHGSGANPRTYEAISGPNFNVRCERPATRALYAIENGGFSGAYMPQNIIVGQQAREVAMFVARFAGRQAPLQPNVTPCSSQAVGTLPPLPTGPVSLSATSSGVNPSAGNPASTTKTPTASPTKAGKKAYAKSRQGSAVGSKAATGAKASTKKKTK